MVDAGLVTGWWRRRAGYWYVATEGGSYGDWAAVRGKAGGTPTYVRLMRRICTDGRYTIWTFSRPRERLPKMKKSTVP